MKNDQTEPGSIVIQNQGTEYAWAKHHKYAVDNLARQYSTSLVFFRMNTFLVYCRIHSVQAISRLAKFNGGENFINHLQSTGTGHPRRIPTQVRIESSPAYAFIFLR